MAVLTSKRGLITLASELTRPDGALNVADNVIIDADNVIEQRRGFGEFGNSIPGDVLPKQLLTYKGRVLRHYGTKLAYDSTGSGAFLQFSGDYVELINGLRIKYFESNGNFFFTTNTGIKKIAATSASNFTTASGYITNAGGVKAVGLEAFLSPNASGFLPAQSKVAYRLVWGTKDVNGNIIQGVPSSRVVLTNTSVDVNIGERFNVSVVNYTLITASQYFTFESPTNRFYTWFNVSGTDTAPVNGDTVGKTGIEVKINGLTTNAQVAAAIAQALSAITDISVELDTTDVIISNVDGGDVLDASQGDLATGAVLVSTVYDGQTATGTPANAELTFVIPNDITTTDYYYEIYRTGIVTVSAGVTLNDIDPGDECQKVYEAPITSADLTAGEITVEDITPDTFREGGAFLYTNPVSGSGILQANEAPPIAQDVALFKGSAFYANTKERHRRQFNFLSVTDFVSGSSKFYVGNSDRVCEYTFVGVSEISDIDVVKKSDTLGDSYIVLYSAQDERKYKIWIDKGIITHSFNSTSAVNNGTDTITIPNHGFANLEEVVFSGTVPTGLTSGNTYYILKTDDNSFQVIADRAILTPINITGVVGTASVTHVPNEPEVADSLSLRVALQTYDDTIQGSKDALIEAFFDILDFEVEDFDSNTVRVYCANNGATTDPSQSTYPTGWTTSVFQQGDGEDAVAKEVLLSGLASVGQAVEETARSLERVINKDPDCPVNAFYLSGVTDLPGILLLESRSLEDDAFYIAISDSVLSSKFNPALPVKKTLTDIAITGNLFTTSSAHGFSIGDSIYLHDNEAGLPTLYSGKFTIATTPSTTTFTLTGVTVDTNQSGIMGVVYLSTVNSDNSVNPNRVYFSKVFQPEAVPLVNYIDIGPKDKAIQRILALRDSLMVFKEDGIYVISGQVAPNFSVRLMDSSALIIAPDAAVNLNNLIYVLTTQGVVSASETGVSVVSRNIENKIQEVTNNKFNFKYVSWAVASESDRSMLVFLPTKVSDTVATQCYRYNTFTRTWTRWNKPATCGVVNPEVDKIYLGSGDPARPYVLQERKNFERQDYSDRDFTRSFNSGFLINDTTYVISSVADVEVGDVIVQTQYLDIKKWNRLLKKLDRDNLLSNDYFSTLELSIGDNIANQLLLLATKLGTDLSPYTIPTPSGVNTATAIRDDYNAIIDALNNPGSGTSFKDYKEVEEELFYESLITNVIQSTNTISVNYLSNFVQGDFQVYKAIKCEVQYAPQHFGKPETLKQISEGTFIFDQTNFWGGTIGYSTDRSYDFQNYTFSDKGPGYFGGFVWADVVYGGSGNEVPVRTLIPQNKQRCRYINIKFIHINAREKWRLIGVSLEPREVSTRGYR